MSSIPIGVPRPCLAVFGFLLAALSAAAACRAEGPPAEPLDLEPEDVRPGLLAEYRSLVEPGATLRRVDRKPAFYLGTSSPHPRLPSGPFEVSWEGLLQVQEQAPLAFGACVGGELSLELDGAKVLEGRGDSGTSRIGPSSPVSLRPGHHRLAIRYRSRAGVPARLQLFWESPAFAREPLPAWRLSHLAAGLPAAFTREERAARGRALAARLGCARCHQGAMPGVDEPPPGPSLADAGRRLATPWLLAWLEDPAKVKPGARMPALFPTTRRGFVERWIVATSLAPEASRRRDADPAAGDHRAGRRTFLGSGCAACHLVPDLPREQQPDLDRTPLIGLGDRLGGADLAEFLGNPRSRYPDGRMPRLPLTPAEARDVAAYLGLWSEPTRGLATLPPPTASEIDEVARSLGVRNRAEAAAALVREKGCRSCHTGLGESLPLDRPIRRAAEGGCPSGQGGARYRLDADDREALATYLADAPRETHPSPFASRARQLERAGCVRCHQRDGDRPPPIEVAGSALGGGFLQTLPYQRTPRLTNPHQKYTRSHLAAAVREGVSGLRPATYTYKMPAFGPEAESLVQALAEQDGELPDEPEPAPRADDDPTLGTLEGPGLVGFQGYGCISCHVWNGRQLAQSDPGAIGPDLTRVVGRIRRDWFDRFLENPGRSSPGTPMPAIFERGKPARIGSVLRGDPAQQRDALWGYFARGSRAPAPKPPAPLPIAAPAPGTPPLVAQIPIHLDDGSLAESLTLLFDTHDLVVYDLAAYEPRRLLTGTRILRHVQGRVRQFSASGTPAAPVVKPEPALTLESPGGAGGPAARELDGYDTLRDGVRLRGRARFAGATGDVEETLRLEQGSPGRRLVRELRLSKVPADSRLTLRVPPLATPAVEIKASRGTAEVRTDGRVATALLRPDRDGAVAVTVIYALPEARQAPAWEGEAPSNPEPAEGSLERPGFRAIAYPRPKTVTGEDRVMPAALAVDPKDGRVFAASLKTGELFVLRDPGGDGKAARFDDYGRGLFQDTLSMLGGEDGLYVLHRRNLTRVVDTDGDGVADRFDRVAALPHGVADTYDYAYGLVRDRRGAFILSYAPYANTRLPGSGGVLRLTPGEPPREVAYGLRNPLGWCSGPRGEVFFTDNQGEWVAANKLCHLEEGRFYGFPNPAQKGHASKPAGRAAVWVPYGWARSINGVAYAGTPGGFGPFSGQFFLAELMFGGAIVRADLEVVNGRYQGVCFPFWGKGLLGPVALAFDPKGRLYVGAINEPGWMAQPDRGALFRIDYTGQMPFEMRTVRARPRGFRIVFTRPVDRRSALDPASYRLEHYRYEYTGAYGSPELDRSATPVEGVRVSADGLSVDLVAPVQSGRVYLVSGQGVRSTEGERLVEPTGAYTMNEVPAAE